jgi:ribonuclease T1
MSSIAYAFRFLSAVFLTLLIASTVPSQAKGLFGVPGNSSGADIAKANSPEIAVGDLPKEAKQTLALIRAGGPFPFEKDGTAFGNREKQLPPQKRGYYKEYTVKTPGAGNRGAKRFVVGNDPKTSADIYYTDDHYQTFKRLRE